jgi:Uncharacterized protein conserved in bacteria (DUF2188)
MRRNSMAKRVGGGRKGTSVHVISSSGRFVKKGGHNSKRSHSAKSLGGRKSSSSKAWSVRTSGSSRAERTFPTKQEAVGYARGVAKKHRSEVYIHRKDGMIVEKDSYGREQLPSRGRRER